jgi:hypothetical protein
MSQISVGANFVGVHSDLASFHHMSQEVDARLSDVTLGEFNMQLVSLQLS